MNLTRFKFLFKNYENPSSTGYRHSKSIPNLKNSKLSTSQILKKSLDKTDPHAQIGESHVDSKDPQKMVINLLDHDGQKSTWTDPNRPMHALSFYFRKCLLFDNFLIHNFNGKIEIYYKDDLKNRLDIE